MRHKDIDARLTERALRHNWSVEPEKRRAMIDAMAELSLDPSAKARQRLAAFKAVIAAETLDLKAVTTAIAADLHEDLKDRVAAIEHERDHPQDRYGGRVRTQPPQARWDDEDERKLRTDVNVPREPDSQAGSQPPPADGP